VFWRVVQNFDLTRGTPFLAHLTQMGEYSLKTEKRINSKITEREVFIDFSLESHPNNPSKDPEDEEALMGALISEISSRNEFEKRVFHMLAIEAAKRAISNKKRLLEYFAVALEICNNSTKRYTDAEAAERMKITRAQVGNLRRQAFEFLECAGLIPKYRGIIAA